MNQNNQPPKEPHNPGVLERLCGARSAVTRVLDFMVIFEGYDYNITDIARNSGLNRSRTYDAIERLEKYELIKKTRLVGQSQMYTFNKEHRAAPHLYKFMLELGFYEAEKTAAEEKAAPPTEQTITN